MATLFGTPIKTGCLKVIDPRGQTHILRGMAAGPEAAVRVADEKLLRRMLVVPDLYLGEGYMDGTLTVEEGTLYDVLDFCACNFMSAANAYAAAPPPKPGQDDIGRKAKADIAHHYDLDRKLFELFLDPGLHYSCAYFTRDGESLEDAQENKIKRVAAKLLLEPGMRVLDIGSGFGGLAIHLARVADVQVTGVTLSKEQFEVAQKRAGESGVEGKVRFKLLDYREEAGRYDRVVSVGMFEHVGRANYDEFFRKVRDVLTDDGVCLLHSIGRMAPPGAAVTWINKYIFPGGYTPSLSETIAAAERAGLWITDVEILRLHYAATLNEWHRRFQRNRDRAKSLYDERFCRMWEFYLQICEVAFRRLNWMVFQIQIAKSLTPVPLTRRYLNDWDAASPAPASHEIPPDRL